MPTHAYRSRCSDAMQNGDSPVNQALRASEEAYALQGPI
jgi:hypothetical protein